MVKLRELPNRVGKVGNYLDPGLEGGPRGQQVRFVHV